MKLRYAISVAGIAAVMLGTVVATAQQTATPVPPSAKARAIEAHGLITASTTADPMVARAIYVKLRRGVTTSGIPVGADRTEASILTASLAEAHGLRGADASPLAFTQMPAAKERITAIQLKSGAERARIAEAEDDLARIVELAYDAAIPPEEAARIMARLPQVEYAEPIYIPHVTGNAAAPPNDPHLGDQYQVPQVKLTQAWEVWKGDTNTVVAIVDAGIDMVHEDLAPNIKENLKETGVDSRGRDKRTNGVDDDGNQVVDDWRGANLTALDDGSTPGDTKGQTHGTSVAGYSSAMTNNGIGIAGSGYRCKFFPIKTALKNSGNLIRAYEGIIYAAKRQFKVINCSFGADAYSQTLQDIITDLIRIHDCAIVAASGNDVKYSTFYPAGYKGILGVGALDGSNGFGTTWGEQVDISSPGGYTTTENNGYDNGGTATSFATPVVSGIVALVRSKFPALNAEQALAHVRQTSDPLPAVTDKVKLTGLGRVNALRAVSTDPFSHPAITVDSLWITDYDGVTVQDRATLGRYGRIRVRLRNILGNATNIRARITMYNADSSALYVKDTAITLAALNTNQIKDVDGGIPFLLKQPNNARLRVRIELTADGGYSDYCYDRMLLYVPYITFRTPDITMSLGDRGHIGFEDFPDNSIGDGFRFTGTSFLYEGGLIVASDPVRVLSNIRTGNPDVQKRDFNTVDYPNASNNYTLTLNDAGAGDLRIGLEMRMRVITADTVSNGIAIQVRTKNISNTTIDTLRVAMFFDWDLDSSDVGQSIRYMEAPKSNVPFYGLIEGNSGYYVAQGVAREVPLPVFFAIRNDSLPIRLFDGFGDDEKWYTVRNGVGSRQAVMTDSSDVSLVLGKRIAAMAPGAEDTMLVVIGIAGLQNEAVTAMRRMAPPYRDTTTGGVNDLAAVGMLLRTIRPNPTTGIMAIDIDGIRPGMQLRMYDAMGRLVADFSSVLAQRDSSGTVTVDATSLPNGIYQIQLTAGTVVETRQIVLVH